MPVLAVPDSLPVLQVQVVEVVVSGGLLESFSLSRWLDFALISVEEEEEGGEEIGAVTLSPSLS